MMRNYTVAEIYARGGHDANGGVISQEARNEHMFIEGKALFSYGYHFPIAVRVGTNQYAFNSDKYSPTTSRHQTQSRAALMQRGAQLVMMPTELLQAIIGGADWMKVYRLYSTRKTVME